MTPAAIIRAAIPTASEGLCDYILFERTAYPFDGSPRSLYRAARRWLRVQQKGEMLCMYCDRLVPIGARRAVCEVCEQAIQRPVIDHPQACMAPADQVI